MKSKRFEKLARRPVNQETYIKPWSETGLTAIASPHDPSPGLTVVDGKVVEMDAVAAPGKTAGSKRSAAVRTADSSKKIDKNLLTMSCLGIFQP